MSEARKDNLLDDLRTQAALARQSGDMRALAASIRNARQGSAFDRLPWGEIAYACQTTTRRVIQLHWLEMPVAGR